MNVALGFRTHSGWAAVVAIALSDKAPVVCDRRLIVLADSEIKGSKQPFHAAEPMAIDKAREFLRHCTASTMQLAIEAVRDCASKMKNDGHEVRAGALLTGAGRVPDSLEAILVSHAAIHAAEGDLYRSAIAQACDVCNLPLTRVREKEAFVVAASAVGMDSKALATRIARLGKTVGPPWSEDQKFAALAAWVALVGTESRHPKVAAV